MIALAAGYQLRLMLADGNNNGRRQVAKRTKIISPRFAAQQTEADVRYGSILPGKSGFSFK